MSVLSNELFVDVHRGVPEAPEMLRNSTGTHWSTSPAVAKVFAEQRVDPREELSKEPYGTILHARMPRESIETDSAKLEKADLFEPEKEVTAKRGSSILVTGYTSLSRARKRSRKFNPPREMTT